MEIKLNNVGMFLLTVALGCSVKVLWGVNKELNKKLYKLKKEVEEYKKNDLSDGMEDDLEYILK